MKHEEPAAEKTIDGFFDLEAIEIPVTYPFLKQKEPMKFFLRPMMNSEEKASRQAFFGLTDAEREQRKHAYNVKLLASLSVRRPENIPLFDEQAKGNTVSALIADFFADTNPMKQMLVEDALTIYYGRIQPEEFFRSF